MSDRLGLIYTGCLLVGLVVTWVLAIRPRWRRVSDRISAALDTLGGRGPIIDPESGKQLAPALQPIGVRLANIEETLGRLAAVQMQMAELHRIATDHEARIGSLEDIDAERTLTREEAVEMWRALNNKDVIDVEQESP